MGFRSIWRRKALTLRYVAAALALMITACASANDPKAPSVGPAGATENTYTGSGSKVAIIGDSLTVLDWKQLYDGLDRRYAVSIAALFGEGYSGGSYSSYFHNILMLNAALDLAKSHPAIVVLALGTNDALSPRPLTVSLTTMGKMVAAFRPACMVGVTLPAETSAKG